MDPYAADDKCSKYKIMQKAWKMTETLANGYSSESTQWELPYEYQPDRVWMVFKNLCILWLWMKVASALEGLRQYWCHCWPLRTMAVISSRVWQNWHVGMLCITAGADIVGCFHWNEQMSIAWGVRWCRHANHSLSWLHWNSQPLQWYPDSWAKEYLEQFQTWIRLQYSIRVMCHQS